MNSPIRQCTGKVLALAVMSTLGWSQDSAARQTFGDFQISGELFVYTEARWGDSDEPGPNEYSLETGIPGLNLGPGRGLPPPPSNGDKFDTLNALRTELLLEVAYTGWDNITPVVKLRPYYDAMFDINDKDHSISKFWETNLRAGVNDNYDPLVREAFVDFNFEPLFVRAGRQLITWGRSDGVTVLDVVSPRNFRNPLTFEQERFLIPQWMIETKVDLSDAEWLPGGIQKELQVIWNLDYTPSRFPGFNPVEEGQHPWTLNVVDFANQIINTSEALFGENWFDDDAYDDGDAIDKSEVFVRWLARTGSDLGPLSDLTYSFHYAYLFDDLPFYDYDGRCDFGLAVNLGCPGIGGSRMGGMRFDRHRYTLAGFSFDKALEFLPGPLAGSVLRGELVYNFGQQFYEPDLELVEADQLTTLIGFDQYFYIGPRSITPTPWFVSLQYWRDEILREAGPGRVTNLNSAACALQQDCGRTGYIIGGATNIFNGLRDETRNVMTLFMFNDFLSAKTLRVELFVLRELGDDQRSTWFRGLIGYNWNSNFSTRIGTNIVSGKSKSFFGQFKENDSMFLEMKYTF